MCHLNIESVVLTLKINSKELPSLAAMIYGVTRGYSACVIEKQFFLITGLGNIGLRNIFLLTF